MLKRGEKFGGTPPRKKDHIDYALVLLALPSFSGPGAITVTIVSVQNPDIE